MESPLNRSITLEYSQAGGFHLFLDGFLFPSMEHPNGFAFHWAIPPLEARPLGEIPPQVNIGPDLFNATLGAVSPDYMVIVLDDVL